MSQTDTNFNTAFIRTRYGILRIAELVISLCAIISMSSGYYCYGNYGKYSFYEFVAVSSLIFLILFLVVIIFKLDQYLIGRINLPLSLLINDAIFTILYVIIAILLFIAIGTCRTGQGARIAAAIFGVLGFLSFAASSIEDYHWFKSGNAPIPLSQISGTGQPA